MRNYFLSHICSGKKVVSFLLACLVMTAGIAAERRPSSYARPADYQVVIYSGEKYQFNNPYGVAIDSKNNVWITNSYENGKVYLTKIPFDTPDQPKVFGTDLWGAFSSITTDKNDNVWVAGNDSPRIQKFPANNPGNPITYGSSGVLGEITSIASDPEGNIWVANRSFRDSWITQFPANNPANPAVLTNELFSFQEGLGITTDPEGNIWAPARDSVLKLPAKDPGNPIRYATEYHQAFMLTSDSKGNIWFSDPYSNSVGKLPAENPGEPVFYDNVGEKLWGITEDKDKNIWVTGTSEIIEFPATSPANYVVYSDSRFWDLYQIKADSNGNMWLTDFPNDSVVKLTKINSIR